MKVFVGKNISCIVNYEYTEIINLLKERCELTDKVDEADAIIFAGTCSCTESRILYVLNYILEILKNKKQDAKVYLTGCMARGFIDSKYFNIIQCLLNDYIDVIIPKNNTSLLMQHLFNEKVGTNLDNFGYAYGNQGNNGIDLFISTGCLNHCSFCKVNYQKTPLHSMDIENLKYLFDEIDDIGIENVYIKGMNIAQYGLDLYNDYKLPEIIDYAETKKNIKQIYLVGLAFKDAIQGGFSNCLQNSSKTTYINGSLESGSDRLLLGPINKGFSSSDFIDFIFEVNKKIPKIITLVIIAGFPTETIDDVKRTIEVLKTINPYNVEISRYIDSPFIPSHNLPNLPQSTINERARIYSKALKSYGINNQIK